MLLSETKCVKRVGKYESTQKEKKSLLCTSREGGGSLLSYARNEEQRQSLPGPGISPFPGDGRQEPGA